MQSSGPAMKRDAIRGHLETLVLSVLSREDLAGAGVSDRLRGFSGGLFDLAAGTLYPALYRLEARGLLESSQQLVNGRRQRVYRLTPAGRRALVEEINDWHELCSAVNAVLGAPTSLD